MRFTLSGNLFLKSVVIRESVIFDGSAFNHKQKFGK